MTTRPRVLLSYWYARRWDIGELLGLVGGADVILDSGAFSAYTSGARIDLDAYARWLTAWKGRATAAFNLDVIGSPAKSARNYRDLLDTDPAVPVIPVFHAGSPASFLDDMLATGAQYVAFGGLVEHFQKRAQILRWAAWHLRTCRDAGVGVHGLGLTAAPVKQLPFYSIDSSTWTIARRGFAAVWDDSRKMVVQVQIRNPDKVFASRKPLVEAGIWNQVRDPNFMVTAAGRLKADQGLLHRTAASAFHLFEEHLVTNHHVPPPESLGPGHDQGTKVYLACTSMDDIRHVMAAWHSHHPERNSA